MYCIYIRRSGAESSAKHLALLFEMLEWKGYPLEYLLRPTFPFQGACYMLGFGRHGEVILLHVTCPWEFVLVRAGDFEWFESINSRDILEFCMNFWWDFDDVFPVVILLNSAKAYQYMTLSLYTVTHVYIYIYTHIIILIFYDCKSSMSLAPCTT